MTSLPDGKYWIVNDAPPKPFIGVDGESPVLADATNKLWTVGKLANGQYTLAIEEAGLLWFIQNEDGQLVRKDTPPSTAWTIAGSVDCLYTIQVPSTTSAWTVNSPDPKSPVTLDNLDVSKKKQKWNFITWPGPL